MYFYLDRFSFVVQENEEGTEEQGDEDDDGDDDDNSDDDEIGQGKLDTDSVEYQGTWRRHLTPNLVI